MYFTFSKNNILKWRIFFLKLIIAFLIILYTYKTRFYNLKQNYIEQSITNNNGIWMNGDYDVEGTTVYNACMYSQSKTKAVLLYFSVGL